MVRNVLIGKKEYERVKLSQIYDGSKIFNFYNIPVKVSFNLTLTLFYCTNTWSKRFYVFQVNRDKLFK